MLHLAAVDVGPVVAVGVLACVLIAAAVADLKTGLIPNRLTLPAMLFGILWATIWPLLAGSADAPLTAAASGLATSLLTCIGTLLAFGLIRMGGGLGWGDVKLMGAVGAITADPRVVLSTTVYALVIAALIAIYLMIRHGLVKRTLRRLGSAAMLAGAKVKPDFPEDGPEASPTVPFALGVAVGGILAASEVLLGLQTPWAGW